MSMGAFGDMTAKAAGWAGSFGKNTITGIGSGLLTLGKTGLKIGVGYGLGTVVNDAVEANTGKSLEPGLAGLIGAFGVCAGTGIINRHNKDDDEKPSESTWKTICKRLTIVGAVGFGALYGTRWYQDKLAAENNLHEKTQGEYLHGAVDSNAVSTQTDTANQNSIQSGETSANTVQTETAAPETTDRSADELLSDIQTETPESTTEFQ